MRWSAVLGALQGRSAYETGRVEPPDGFPKLPDRPSGATDPAFQGSRPSTSSSGSGCTGHGRSCPRPAATSCATSGAPILLARDDDGEVRAFYNACRHHWAPVVRGWREPMLVCQFHSWGYNLLAVVRVPDGQDIVGLQKEERCLPGALQALGRLVLRPSTPMRSRCSSTSTHSPAVAGWRPRRSGHRYRASSCVQLEAPGRGLPRGVPRPDDPPETVGPSLTPGAVITLYDRPPEHAVAGQHRHTVRQP